MKVCACLEPAPPRPSSPRLSLTCARAFAGDTDDTWGRRATALASAALASTAAALAAATLAASSLAAAPRCRV